MSDISNLPSNDDVVDFDLDAEEAGGNQPRFKTRIGGRSVEMISMEDMNWEDLAIAGDNPVYLMQYALSEDDLKHVREQNLNARQLGKLMDAYMKFYGIDKQATALQRAQRLQSAGGR